MFRQIGAGEIILVLAVLLLLFGAKKLPELARSLGRSAKELKDGMREGEKKSEEASEESETEPS
jgi:sec-independent protein translocase protein TatA